MGQKKVGVIGLGNWGTALANHLAKNGHHVTAWSANKSIVEEIKKTGRNPKYLREVNLSKNLICSCDLDEFLSMEYLVIATPAASLQSFEGFIKRISKETIIISGVKGFVPDFNTTPADFISSYYPHVNDIACVAGPCFAKDLASAVPCVLVAASYDEPTADAVATLFVNEYLRVYTSKDVIGVELGGILKNIIALAVGVSDGIGLGNSAKAALITRGLTEMRRFATSFGAEDQTLFGLSGLGDLTMTATSDLSRNRTVGLRLGAGETLSSIVAGLHSVAEAVTTTGVVYTIAQEKSLEMPITEVVYELLQEKITPLECVKKLLMRPLKKEFLI
jgi:glycerol-3-phosphate dehydrogenase (NAD(P)+)